MPGIRLSFLLILLFGLPSFLPASYDYTFPHFAAGGGWSSDIYLTNQGSQPAAGVEVFFFYDNGSPMTVSTNLGTDTSFTFTLAAGEAKSILSSPGVSLITGHVQVRIPYGAAIRGSEIFRYTQGGTVLTQVGVGMQWPFQHFSFPVEVRSADQVNAGVALVNPVFEGTQDSGQVVLMNLIRADGTLRESAVVRLTPGQHTSKFLNQLFPGIDNFSGTLSISAPGMIGALALRQDQIVYGGLAIDTGAVLSPFMQSGTSLSESEPNDDRTSANAMTRSGIYTGAISTTGDVDYFSFVAKRDDIVSFLVDTQTITSRLDSVIRLENADGTLLAENDQNGLFLQNDSFLQISIPADGTYYLRVADYFVNGGTDFSYRLHAVVPAQQVGSQPQITALSPATAKQGETVTLTITGTNLSGVTSVSFSSSAGMTVSAIQATANQVTCRVAIDAAALAGSRWVTVTGTGGTSNTISFVITSSALPQINPLLPTSGRQGENILFSIGGTNLLGATAVNFNPSSGITVTELQSTKTIVTCLVSISASAALGPRTLTVTTPAGTSNSQPFSVITSSLVPQITSVSPSGARQGSTVTLSFQGLNLSAATAINFNPTAGITVTKIYQYNSNASCDVAIAASAAPGIRSVSVTSAQGTSNSLPFAVLAAGGTAAPVISNLTVSKFVTSSGKSGLSGSFDFTDADGDILYTGSATGSAKVVFSMSSGTCSIIDSGNYLDKAGQTSGHVEFSFTFTAGGRYIGSFSVYFQLIDASGNQSNTLTVSPTPQIWDCLIFHGADPSRPDEGTTRVALLAEIKGVAGPALHASRA